MSSSPEIDALQAALAAPFPAEAIDWKPQAVSGNRALAIAFIDARAVMDRLDAVVGAAAWRDEYEVLPDGNVVCTLTLKVTGEWVAKSDVGSPSDQPDAGDKRKASFSDALKRVGVKWGIGRYLYSLPAQWVDYDANKRQFARTPSLPSWAIPAAKQTTAKPTPAATAGVPWKPTQAAWIAMKAEMHRIGWKWVECLEEMQLPGTTRFRDLTQEQYEAIFSRLRNAPVPQPAAAKQ